MSSVDVATIVSAFISTLGLVVVALIPKREVRKLRAENTDQHLVNKQAAEDTRVVLERFEAAAEYDRKSILKAVTAVERKVEKVDSQVDGIDQRLSHHIDWHLDRGK